MMAHNKIRRREERRKICNSVTWTVVCFCFFLLLLLLLRLVLSIFCRLFSFAIIFSLNVRYVELGTHTKRRKKSFTHIYTYLFGIVCVSIVELTAAVAAAIATKKKKLAVKCCKTTIVYSKRRIAAEYTRIFTLVRFISFNGII